MRIKNHIDSKKDPLVEIKAVVGIAEFEREEKI